MSLPSLLFLAAALAVAPLRAQPRAHWAFTPPRRVEPPSDPTGWARNPVDRFVLVRLTALGLRPSPAADRATLLRRLSLDLCGLPPDPAEVDAFAADPRPDAYAEAVRRLLASPHHGERMALHWLDLARYGDTHGYHIDSHREMWVWRDWVVDAFNRNMPFDQFTIEQLAGDLLPEPTLAQRVATGFHRNHMINVEGGADPAEYSVRYVVDRVNTTGSTWLGLTIGCAECHDHKHDPISQREYYGLYAFFGNVPENGLDGFAGNAMPFVKVPTPAAQAELLAAQQELLAEVQALEARGAELDAAQAEWERGLVEAGLSADVRDGLVAAFELDGDDAGEVANAAAPARAGRLIGGQLPAWVPGMVGRALRLDGTGTHVRAGADGAVFDRDDPFSVAAFVEPLRGGVVVGRWDEDARRGWALVVRNGRVSLQLSRRMPEEEAHVVAAGSLYPGFNHVAASHDGSGRAAGLALYVNGRRVPATVLQDTLCGSLENEQPLRIGGNDTQDSFDGALDDVRVYDRALTDREVELLALRPVRAVLGRPETERGPADMARVRDHFRRHVSPLGRAVYDSIRPRQTALVAKFEAIPTVMVMAELPEPRPSRVLLRGDYRRPGEVVAPDVPAVLPPLPAGVRRDRLALARWLVDPEHPLTARVFVNRLWEQLFGTGLVRTSGDLGTRGEPPTHPELLDWLADEFVRSGFDVRHMLTLLVTSATYQQTGAGQGAPADRDLRWLSAMRRGRLPAELVRDQCLAAAGILDLRVGGPGSKPVQPAGLWEEVAYGAGFSDQEYVPSPVGDRYRRGLYVYVKRSAPYASFRAFDVPTREICTVQRDATTTPAQAFVLLNDPVYIEAARALGARMLGAPGDDRARLAYGFRRCVARAPAGAELALLEAALARERARYAADPVAAAALLAAGDLPAPGFEPRELAAWTIVASVLLNKSETITRP